MSEHERPEELPQRLDHWQVGVRQLDTSVRVGDETLRPWMTAVFSRSDGQILTMELSHEAPAAADLWETLLEAMHKPEAGEAHRPTEIQLTEAAWCDELAPRLQALDIACRAAAQMEEVDAIFAGLASQLGTVEQDEGGGQAGLLDMPGVTPEAAGSFFDAAALFYEQAPWKKVGERAVAVACARFESGPWYAILMGQGGMARGLVLYDNLEILQRIQSGTLSDEENARLSTCLAVVFGTPEDLPQADLDAIEQYGWRVASPEAYPAVYRMEPGLSMRPPLAWELTLLEAALRALPEFARKKTRRLEPLMLDVPTAGGALPLTLSWTTEAG